MTSACIITRLIFLDGQRLNYLIHNNFFSFFLYLSHLNYFYTLDDGFSSTGGAFEKEKCTKFDGTSHTSAIFYVYTVEENGT